MGFKLIILAAIGLGSLYMMHLLAMDYMKIRRVLAAAKNIGGPAAAALTTLLRGKRDINNNFLNRTKNTMPEIEQFVGDNLELNWLKITKNDPLNCLSLLICQIVAGAENGTEEAYNIQSYVEFSYEKAPIKIQGAYNQGVNFLNEPERCFGEYPFCIYSAKTMFKILKWFIRYVL